MTNFFVDHKDRNPDTNYLRMLFNMLEIQIDYIEVDLILQAMEQYKKKGANLDMKDTAKIKADWVAKWSEYRDIKIKERENKSEITTKNE